MPEPGPGRRFTKTPPSALPQKPQQFAAPTAAATQATAAPLNLAPPASGLEILDLAGTPIRSGYTNYAASFTATTASSTVTFVFRHDPGFFGFDDVSVRDRTTNSVTNLIVNSSFEQGAPTASGGGAPGWTYFQQAGVSFLGQEAPSGANGNAAHSGAYFWSDGATGGYDGLSQTFATTSGDTYAVSFFLSESGANTANYQQVSTNGQSGTAGNGIDVAVYAGNGVPSNAVPEPASLALLGLAAAFCGLTRQITRQA